MKPIYSYKTDLFFKILESLSVSFTMNELRLTSWDSVLIYIIHEVYSACKISLYILTHSTTHLHHGITNIYTNKHFWQLLLYWAYTFKKHVVICF